MYVSVYFFAVQAIFVPTLSLNIMLQTKEINIEKKTFSMDTSVQI